MSHEVLPRLLTSGKLKVIVHKTVLTQGVPESMLAIRIEEWENNLPPFIRLAYLPNPTSVRLRLTAIGTDAQLLRQEIDRQVGLLQLLLPTEIFGYDSETMADSVSRLLKAKKQVLAVAESCTGGYISHLLTLIPGASEWYAGGITAYGNSVKTNLLGVHPETLLQYGAVSEDRKSVV